MTSVNNYIDTTCMLSLSGKFRQFDYGEMGNLKHYGQITPPDYRLEKVDVPVAIYYGSHDWCATPEVRYRPIKLVHADYA